MGFLLQKLLPPLLFIILIIETTALDSNDSSPDTNHRSPGRGRIINQYSGTRPEPILCNNEGFQADPHNCAVFHRCMKSGKDKYTSFRFQCGPGTVYDPEKEVCNYPHNTRRLECGGLSPPISHDLQINEIQGQMSNEIPSPIVTSDPIYNPNMLIPSHVTSTPSSSYPWGSSNNPIYIDHNAIAMKPLNTITNVPRPISRDNICTSDGFMGDSENCRKFYRCVANQRGGFTRYEFSCTENTIWDNYNQLCNHVWAVKRTRCGNLDNKITHLPLENSTNQNVREIVSNHTTQQQLQVGYGTKVTQTQTQISNGFVNQNQTQINYGDRIDQNDDKRTKQNQTQISNGSAISQSQLQINYGNKGVQTQLQIDHSNKASQNQIQVSETSSEKASTTTRHLDSQEATKYDTTECTEAGFMEDINNCQKFYRCIENGQGGYHKFGFTCAEGTAWDPNIRSCNHLRAFSGCTRSSQGSTTNTLTTTTNKNIPSYSTTISTQNYHTTPQVTVNEDDEDIGYGNSKPNYLPSSSSSTTLTVEFDLRGTECENSGFMGDDKNCKIFYRCVQNNNGGFTKYVFNCAEGTLWDPEINACNHAWAVKKCGGTIFPDINKVDSITKTPTASSPMYTHPPPDLQDNDLPGYVSQVDSDNLHDIGTTTSKLVTTTASNSESPTSEGSKCTQSGFMGDSNNCKIFYRCVDVGNGSYTKFEFMCGEGTLWDDEIKSCNHAWAVSKCGVVGSSPINDENIEFPSSVNSESETSATTLSVITTSTEPVKHETESQICVNSGFFGDKNYCEKFYRCVDNGSGSFTRYEYVCGEGTVWDQGLNACNHAWAVEKCGTVNDSTIHKPSEIITESSITTSTSIKIPHTTNTVTTTISREENNIQNPTPNPLNSTVVCTSEGFFGDKYNCRKFYRCVNNENGSYTTYYFNCGEGTVWDQELQVCNHESQSKCTNSTAGDLQNNDSQTKPESDTGITEQNLTASTISTTSSSKQCESEGFFAIPNDCNNFIRCVANNQGGFTKYEFACSEGTIWVQKMLTCYHDTGEVYCNQQTNVENQQTTKKYELTTSKHTEKENQNDEVGNSVTMALPAASDICLSEGYYPNTKDCRRFYKCVDNGKGSYAKIDYTCSEGTAWDSHVQTCNHINRVASCKDSIMYDEDTQTTENVMITSHSVTSTSSTTATSNISQKPITNTDLQGNDRCNSEGYFGNTQDCKKFYRCVGNGKGNYTKYDFDCAEGTIWDKDVTTCNHPENVVHPSCNQVQNSSSTTEDSSFNGSTTSTTENNQQTSKKPVNMKINCTKAGFFADPDDCKQFYRCVDWDGNETKFSVYHFECGEGTIWDPALETCNHEDSVYPPRDCSGSHSQSSTTEDTTTTELSTQMTSQAITDPTTPNLTTLSAIESTTNPANELTTSNFGENTTTELLQESTTEQSGEGTTEQSLESTTGHLVASTTEQSTVSTTDQSGESTTEELGESTTNKSVESTTEDLSLVSTTEQSTESTTEQLGDSTTEQLGQSTTEKSRESTTEHLEASTTEQLGQSTTEKSEKSTTEQLEDSTTEQLGESTTENTEKSTTEASEETITENNLTTESITESSTETLATANCPEIDSDQNLFVCPSSFRRHPKYCNLFYQCDENDDTHDLKIAMFTCPNNTIYDETKVKCVENSKAEKPCDGNMAKKRRVKRKDRIDNNVNDPIVVSEKSFACTAAGYYPFETDGDCSPGFLKCMEVRSNKLRGLVYQCPAGYLFWTVSRRCEPMFKVSDCKRSVTNDWRRRWEIPMETKNVAW